MVALDELLDHLDDELEAPAFADYGPNGLQVAGRQTVQRLISGVSASSELLERAIERRADAVLVHHGILWGGAPARIQGPLRRRLKLLLEHDVSLIAYHLPLDAHATLGNNALLAQGLRAVPQRPFAEHRGRPIGSIARFEDGGVAAAELFARVEALCGRTPLVFPAGPDRVEAIGIVSGAGASHLGEAIDLRLDAFVTGEPAERSMAEAAEAGIHFIAAGHYATETFGVRELGERLARRFSLTHEFVEIPNPV